MRMRLALLGWAASGLLAACTKSGQSNQAAAPDSAPGPLSFADHAPRADKEKVLVITPFSSTTHALWRGLRDSVSEEMDVVTLEAKGDAGVENWEQTLDQVHPKCVVLIGNASARRYAEVEQRRSDEIPTVVLMSSFAHEVVSGLRHGTGIAYEVPGVTSFVRLRRLYERPIRRVGVLFRDGFDDFIAEQGRLAHLEQVELVGRSVTGDLGPRALRLRLKELLEQGGVDALWVLNDNALLTSELLRSAWLPELRGRDLPVVVGVENLVSSELKFGSVAVVPDVEALGVQAANLLYDLRDSDWRTSGKALELPLSVRTIVDMNQTSLKMAPGAASSVDLHVE
jgi:hypothetical protein